MAGFDDDSELRGPDFSRGDVLAQEQSPDSGTSDPANESNPFGYPEEKQSPSQPQSGSRWKQAANKLLDRRKGLIFGAGSALIIITAIAYFSLSLAPISFLDGIMPDLNTAVGSLVMAHNSLIQTKLLYSSEAVSGCKTLSITCKFSTMSKEQAARYAKAGFSIEAEGKTKLLGRVKVKSITFQGETYSPKEFLEAKKTNIALRNADLRANNMSYLSTKTARFATWVLERFGVSKQKPGLSGSKTDRVNQLLTATGKSNPSEISFTEVKDENGKPTGRYTVDGAAPGADGKPVTYSATEVEDMKTKIAAFRNRPVLNKIQGIQSTATFQNLLKAASITGYVDLGCTLYDMVGAAAVAAKINTQHSLIEFAQPTFALIQSIKAGDETTASESVSALGTLLTKVDTRKQIWQNGKLIDNPNYNSSAMTSPLVQMSGDGKVRTVTTETTQFTSGMSVQDLLGGAGEAYTFLQQSITKAGCAIVQNWFVRGASLAVGIFAAIGTSGAGLAWSAGVSAVILGAMYAVQVALSNAIQGPDLQSAFDSGSTETIGSALWLGLAYEMGAQASSSGLVPGNTSEIVNYQTTVMDEVNSAYASMEKEDGQNNPFDVTNQYSFLGSAARQVGSVTNYGESPVSILTGIVALATGRTLSSSNSAYATADLTADRFEQCQDTSYSSVGINADAGCNLRYIMLPEDVTRIKQDNSALKVAQWMENNGYVEKDTLTGLPIGYVAPSSTEGQSAAEQFVTGAVAGVIGQFYNGRQYGTGVAAEYGKFLDFCANRTMPYGEQYNGGDNAINGVEDGWITGSKCMEHSEMLSNFRVYTNLLAAQESEDEEKPVASGQSTANGTCPAGSTTSTQIIQGYWDGSYQDGVFCIIDNTTDASLEGPDGTKIKDADLFSANNDLLQTNDTGKIVVRADAAQDMVDLVKKYQEDTKKSTFDVTFSYRSHNQQCLMFYYTNYNKDSATYSKLPSACTGLTQNQADALRVKMTGGYVMPKPFYQSNHESGHAFDASDLGWVEKCVSGNYDGNDSKYKSGSCFNFVPQHITNDEKHVAWEGD